jgi:hypothetical protein
MSSSVKIDVSMSFERYQLEIKFLNGKLKSCNVIESWNRGEMSKQKNVDN